jgi:hypothetical protein
VLFRAASLFSSEISQIRVFLALPLLSDCNQAAHKGVEATSMGIRVSLMCPYLPPLNPPGRHCCCKSKGEQSYCRLHQFWFRACWHLMTVRKAVHGRAENPVFGTVTLSTLRATAGHKGPVG